MSVIVGFLAWLAVVIAPYIPMFLVSNALFLVSWMILDDRYTCRKDVESPIREQYHMKRREKTS